MEISGYARFRDWINKDTPFAQGRQFGLRADNITDWEVVPLNVFAGEAAYMRTRLLNFEALLETARHWGWEPFYSSLDSEETMPKQLREWIMRHNDLAQQNIARRQKVMKRVMSQDNGLKEMRQAAEEEARALKKIVQSGAKTTPRKLRITYFKSLESEIAETEKQMLEWLAGFNQLIAGVNPLEMPDPDDMEIVIEGEDD